MHVYIYNIYTASTMVITSHIRVSIDHFSVDAQVMFVLV